jgi:hypothetical protein
MTWKMVNLNDSDVTVELPSDNIKNAEDAALIALEIAGWALVSEADDNEKEID